VTSSGDHCPRPALAFMIWIMFDRLFVDIPGAAVAHFEADEPVFRQGDPVRAIFQVREGAVAMVRHLSDGTMLTIATASAGETFAEAALFSDRYHCDAIARSKSVIAAAPVAAIRARLEAEPKLAIELAEAFSAQVRQLRALIEIQRIKRAPDRLLAWLRWRSSGNPPVVEAPDAWSRVASGIGLSPETLYRALRTLEEHGQISRYERVIMLSPKRD